jgi:16S rRNA (adenine1518-N6/adenine1519-N6)-dimethyltransferase
MKRREGEKGRRGEGETKHKSLSRIQSTPRFSATPSPRLPVSPSLHSSLRPSKRLGQNFLVGGRVIDRIIRALGPRNDETIIEIGPGRGALTARLVENAGRVIAIEFDRKLIPPLLEQFGSRDNFKLVQGDALTTDFCDAISPARQARVVANLPYNIATAILQRLIEQRSCLSEMVLMLQREVVDRITAPPGSTDRGFLSVLVEAYCETDKLFDVAPGSFRPAPKVWSSVIRLKVRSHLVVDVQDEKLLWQIVSAGFAQRRKTILNNLRDAPEPIQALLKKRGGASIVLCEAGIPPLRRAETFTLEEWSVLVNAIG